MKKIELFNFFLEFLHLGQTSGGVYSHTQEGTLDSLLFRLILW